jgi:hypothetical protein
MAFKDQPVLKDFKDIRDQLVHKDFKEIRDQLAHKDFKEIRDQLVHKDFRDIKEQLARRATTVLHIDILALQVHPCSYRKLDMWLIYKHKID